MSSKAGFKQQLFTQFARVGKAVSNGNRLELLAFLAQGERRVEELATAVGLTMANASQHLQQLRQAGLVTSRKEGLKVYYQLSGAEVLGLFEALRQVAEHHLAEVGQLVVNNRHTMDSLEPVSREQLFNGIRGGLMTVIDVRPATEFAAGHVPGALNISLGELEQRLEEFNPGQEIVVYCRGPHCLSAFVAVARLREKGCRARRLEGGYPEWKMAGLPVDESKD